MAVATGHDFTLIVTEDGNICAFGQNDRGQLGSGELDDDSRGTRVVLQHKSVFAGHAVVMVAATAGFSCCVTSDGAMWNWGCNYNNRLGPAHTPPPGEPASHASCLPRRMPMALHGNSPVVMLACAFKSTLLLTAQGRIWQFGDSQPVPACVDPAHFGGAEIGMISAGARHYFALAKTGGNMWSWGHNEYGQAGVDSDEVEIAVPTAVSGDLDGDQAVFVSCGYDFSMVVTTDGVLWACGRNSTGECGISPDRMEYCRVLTRVGGAEYFGPGGVRMVSCAHTHSIILAKNHSVWTCGLGTGTGWRHADRRPSCVPLPVTPDPEVPSDTNVLVVFASSQASYAITSAGSVHMWARRQPWEEGSVCSPRLMADWVMGLAGSTSDKARAGRWHGVNRARAMAAAMGVQGMLATPPAADAPWAANISSIPSEVLENIFRGMRFSVRPGTSPGIERLMGMGP